MANQSCYDWGVDETQRTITRWVDSSEDISRTIQIRINTVAAATLEEPNLACSNLTADGTAFASVLRIDENNLHASFLCLVGKELTELVETPTTQKPVEFPTLTLFPNTFKVLQPDNASCGKTLNNQFGDSVVHITHKQSLPSADTLQMSLSRRSAFALKRTPKSTHLVESVGYTLKEHIVACDCEVVYSKVDANVVNRTTRSSLISNILFGDNHVQPQTTFIIPTQLSTTNTPIEVFGVVGGESECVLLATCECGKATNSFFEFDPITSSIVSDTSKFEFGLTALEGNSGFDGLTGLGYCGNNQLGRQLTGCSNVFVDDVVYSETIALNLPTLLYNLLADLSVLREGIVQLLSVLKPYLYCPVHSNLYRIMGLKMEVKC